MKTGSPIPRAWLVYPLWNFQQIPSLRALAEGLVQRGWQVTVFVGPGTDLVGLESSTADLRWVRLPGKNASFLVRGLSLLLLWLPAMVWRALGEHPRALIGVAQWGLMLTGPLSWLLRVPGAYLNTELQLLADRQGAFRRGFKRLERALNRRCAFSIIQDSGRADALAAENGVPRDSVLLLPNSPSGQGRKGTTQYLRQRFGLGPDRRILLYVGSIISHFLVREILAAFARLPEHYALVLHSPDLRGGSPYVAQVKADADALPGRVFLSDRFLSADELEELVASADVGLAYFYPLEGNELNERLVGLSSGKIALYLQNGVPVATTDFASLAWITARRCGSCEPGPENLHRALASIERDLDGSRERARAAFREHLSPEPHLDRIATRLGALR